MAKFRKIPVVIEAVQFNPGIRYTEEEKVFLEQGVCFDDCLATGWRNADGKFPPHVHTLEGSSYELPIDYWIIKGIKGEFYPCEPDIFYKTYEIINE